MYEHLSELARDRSKHCLEAVTAAVRSLQQNGEPLTINAVARAAGVSRNYIYSTPAALELVRANRKTSSTARGRTARIALPATDGSLLARLAAAQTVIEELKAEIGILRQKNEALFAEVVALQNPLPENVTPIRRRRM